MYGKVSEANKHYAEAQNFYQRIFDLGRNEKDIKYGCGRIFFARKNWDVALAFYNEAISIAADMSEAYLGLGKTYFELGNERDAFDCFESARQWSRRSKSMIDEADVETAYGDVLYHSAIYHKSSDNYEICLENAILRYEKAIQIRENAMAYAGLGKTYAELHRDQEAIDALNRALELTPNLIQCYFIKGKCYYNVGQYSEAYAEYEKASKAGLNTVPFQKAFGEVLLVMKRYKDASQIIDTTINCMYRNMDKYANKDFSYIFCHKGIAFHGQGEDEKAIPFFFKAQEYDQCICWERQYRQALEDMYYQNAFNGYCTALQINQNYQAAYRAKLRVESKIVQPQTSFWQKLRGRLNI